MDAGHFAEHIASRKAALKASPSDAAGGKGLAAKVLGLGGEAAGEGAAAPAPASAHAHFLFGGDHASGPAGRALHSTHPCTAPPRRNRTSPQARSAPSRARLRT